MEDLLNQMKMVYKVMGEKEFAQSIAIMLWSIYNECVIAGFSNEEAMAITLSFAKSQAK